ncbi:hypothetical protein K502DRAFT_345636 [Neoconidiobolus thromboides FSU 785]|nr:hypothetical protein K502DRAFT_345636 [Neoconidiobolus thromboides FSU 785]
MSIIQFQFYIFLFLWQAIINTQIVPLSRGYCILMKNQIYYLGGSTSNNNKEMESNKNVYALDLSQPIHLNNNQAPWKKINSKINQTVDWDGSRILTKDEDKILSFGGSVKNISFFNELNIKNMSLTILNKESLKLPGIQQDIHTIIQPNLVQHNNFAYLFGGIIINKRSERETINGLYQYNITKKSWMKLQLSLNNKYGTDSVYINNTIYSVGGYKEGKRVKLDTIDIIKFDKTISLSNHNLTGDIPKSTAYTAVFGDNFMYLIASDDSFKQENELYILNLITLTWQKVQIENLQLRPMACTIVYKNFIIHSFGGGMNDGMDQTQIIDINTLTKVYSTNNTLNNPTRDIANNTNNNVTIVDSNYQKALIGGIVGTIVFIGLVGLGLAFYYRKVNENKHYNKIIKLPTNDDFETPPDYAPLSNLETPYFTPKLKL